MKNITKTSQTIVPCDISAEMAILSSILMDTSFALSQIAHLIDEDDFYKESHQIIYRIMFQLYEQNIPVDSISLGSRLNELNQLEFIGGYAYLGDLVTYAPTAQNVEYYARMLRGKSQLRKLIQVANEIQEKAVSGEADTQAIIDQSEQMILNIVEKRDTGDYSSIRALANQALTDLEQQMKHGGLSGLTSGFPALDKLTNGFQNSDLIILAARPSMGKTALALNIAANIAIHQSTEIEQGVLIFSLEMSEQQLTRRFLASEARVDSSKIQSGQLSTHEWKKFVSTMDRIKKAPIYISEASGLSYLDMKALARRVQSKHSLSLVIVDYLQLVMLPSRRSNSDNRQNEVAEISRSLKQMARELNIPVIALSQLSRDVEKRNTKRPMLSDLRDSGAIEQDADLVAFIHRPEYYDKEDESKKGIAEVIIAKHRNGAVGDIKLTFINQYTRFESYAAEQS